MTPTIFSLLLLPSSQLSSSSFSTHALFFSPMFVFYNKTVMYKDDIKPNCSDVSLKILNSFCRVRDSIRSWSYIACRKQNEYFESVKIYGSHVCHLHPLRTHQWTSDTPVRFKYSVKSDEYLHRESAQHFPQKREARRTKFSQDKIEGISSVSHQTDFSYLFL